MSFSMQSTIISHSNFIQNTWLFRGGLLRALVLSVSGCVTELPSLTNPEQLTDSTVVGHALTMLTG